MTNPRALFIGTKHLGLSAMAALRETLGDSLVGAVTFDDSADERSVLSDFRAFSAQHAVELAVITKPSQLLSHVRIFEPSAVFVLGWYWILSPELLASAPHGWVGLHASLLPKYRGNAPLVWAILRGETQTGMSLFYFDEGMDTGDVVAQQTFEIGHEDTIAEALAKVDRVSIALIRENASAVLNGSAKRTVQDHSQATYGAQRRPEDGRIDWTRSAGELYNFVRAQTRPYPGAFTSLSNNDQPIRIWRASVFPSPYYGTSGLIVQFVDSKPVVTCGEGAMILEDYDSGDTALKWGMRLL
jgi:methionyl-tRNA formyltransferase